VMIDKGDGTLRMCIDFRALNKKMIHQTFQLPLISEVLEESFNRGMCYLINWTSAKRIISWE